MSCTVKMKKVQPGIGKCFIQSKRAGQTLPVSLVEDAFLSPKLRAAPSYPFHWHKHPTPEPSSWPQWPSCSSCLCCYASESSPATQSSAECSKGLDSTHYQNYYQQFWVTRCTGVGSGGEEEWERRKVRKSRRMRQARKRRFHCSLVPGCMGPRQRARKCPLFLWPKWDREKLDLFVWIHVRCPDSASCTSAITFQTMTDGKMRLPSNAPPRSWVVVNRRRPGTKVLGTLNLCSPPTLLILCAFVQPSVHSSF
jgi:hypothetical protein